MKKTTKTAAVVELPDIAQEATTPESVVAPLDLLTEQPFTNLSINCIVKHDQPQEDIRQFLDQLPRGYEVVMIVTKPIALEESQDWQQDYVEPMIEQQQPDGNGVLKMLRWNYWGEFHFGNARNVALAHSTRDWVLWLDIDDRIKGGWDLLQELANVPAGVAGVFCGVAGFQLLPANSEGSNFYTAEQLRIFRRYSCLQWAGWVHEQILPSILGAGYTTTKMPLLIEHLGYAVDTAAMLEKYRRNMELLLLEVTTNKGKDRRFYLKYLAGTIQTYLDQTKQEE